MFQKKHIDQTTRVSSEALANFCNNIYRISTSKAVVLVLM